MNPILILGGLTAVMLGYYITASIHTRKIERIVANVEYRIGERGMVFPSESLTEEEKKEFEWIYPYKRYKIILKRIRLTKQISLIVLIVSFICFCRTIVHIKDTKSTLHGKSWLDISREGIMSVFKEMTSYK